MWNDLTMRERADLIRQGVVLGYKDIDSIRNNYHIFGKGSTLNSSYQDPNPYYNRLDDKHKKEWRSLSAQRQKFNQMLQQYSPQIYNDPQLRNTMEFIAFNEGRWVRPTNVPKSGATGYFQLTPPTIRTYNQAHNTNYSTKDPAQDFAMMQYTVQTSMDNINKLLKDPTFRKKAQELGWDQYDLLKASWLLGPTGMKNHVLDPKKYNPKDEYGSSASSYVKNNNSTGDDVMIVNRGVEQPPAILITPEDVRRKLEEDKLQEEQLQEQPYSWDIQQQEGSNQNISDTFLYDQYERLAKQNAELSQADQEMKEKWNQMMENVQAEQERQNIVSMINTLGWQKAQPITPVQGQITNDERVYNNPVLAAQMYNRRNNHISNGSFGKYFFNGQEDNTPMILGYNPYSPVMALGGPVHRYDLAGTVNTPYSNNNPEGWKEQSQGINITPPEFPNRFAFPQYYPQYEWDPEQFYPTTRLGTNDAIYDNIDMTKPYEPIQSYPRVGEVNPVYTNPTVKGEPVEILHRVNDSDNQAVARYQDGELGIVNLPDNYWQRYLPEVVIPGRMQQLQGAINEAQQGKSVQELEQDLDNHLNYMDEKDRAEQDAFYNPRAVLDNASRIPLVGVLPTMSEYIYGTLKGGPEGQYWKDRAGGAANEQMLPIGLVAANTNPVTAAMVDSALLGTSLYDIDRNGFNEENGIGLALGMMGPTARGTQFIRNNTLPYNLEEIDATGGLDRTGIPYEIKETPGYQLKTLMKGNPLEKQVSKKGTISVNSIKAQAKKASKVEEAVINKVLSSGQFAGQKVVDYNDFRRAVQNELITYERIPSDRYASYGIDRLGLDAHIYNGRRKTIDSVLINAPEEFKEKYDIMPDPYGPIFYEKNNSIRGPIPQEEVEAWIDKNLNSYGANTYTFESPRIPIGNAKHYNRGTLGHSRTYITPEEPQVLHVMESQNDWAQNKPTELLKTHDIRNLQDWENEMAFQKENQGEGYKGVSWEKEMEGLKAAKAYVDPETSYLIDNYERRQLQENLKYAAEHGLTKMRYPTSDTAAKIEGYTKRDIYEFDKGFKDNTRRLVENIKENNKDLDWSGINDAISESVYQDLAEGLAQIQDNTTFLNSILDGQGVKYNEETLAILGELRKQYKRTNDYTPAHKTILRKYSAFPKQYKKLYRDAGVRTVTDSKGNTWYEVDVPENYLEQEWPYKYGGTLNS